MHFYTTLLKQYNLMESLDSVIKSNPSIPEETIRHYHSTALPDNNKGDRLLNHVLKMHKSGNITPNSAYLFKPHLTALAASNQFHQLKNLNTLNDHINATKDIANKLVTKKERVYKDTPTVFENDDIIIKHHLTHESAVKAAQLHPDNPLYNSTNEKGKAQWCVSSDSDLGKKRFDIYTENGKYPLYTITNKKTKTSHALVASNNPPEKVEFRNEKDANPPSVNNITSISGTLYKYPGIEKSIVGTYLKDKFPEDIHNLQNLPHDANSSIIQKYIDTGTPSEKFSAYLHPNITNKQMQNGLSGTLDERKMVLSNHKLSTDIIDDYLKTEFHGPNISAALYHPNISYNAVQNALKSNDLHVHLTALHQYKHITPDNINHAQESGKAVIRAMAATHPKLNNEQLTRAIKDEDELVNSMALNHASITPEHIDHITNGNDIKLIRQALDHKNATTANFNKVATHHDAYVRDSLLDHPKIKKEQLEILANDNVPSIAAKAVLKLKNLDK